MRKWKKKKARELESHSFWLGYPIEFKLCQGQVFRWRSRVSEIAFSKLPCVDWSNYSKCCCRCGEKKESHACFTFFTLFSSSSSSSCLFLSFQLFLSFSAFLHFSFLLSFHYILIAYYLHRINDCSHFISNDRESIRQITRLRPFECSSHTTLVREGRSHHMANMFQQAYVKVCEWGLLFVNRTSNLLFEKKRLA